MGRQNQSANSTSQGNQHFSHPHILKPIVSSDQPKTLTCNACEQPSITSNLYGCKSCQYFLHENCLNAPRFLNHSSHPSHPLTLHQIPTYSSRSYTCKACSSAGSGFCFSCACCEFDIHLQCASCPSSILVDKHPHQLGLHFGSPYTDKNLTYVCDMCNVMMNQDDWLYYCAGCDFASHLQCAVISPEVGVFPKQQRPNPNPSSSPSSYANSYSNPNPRPRPISSYANSAVDMINSVNDDHDRLIAAQIAARIDARGRQNMLDLI